jgi:hypothetical protein
MSAQIRQRKLRTRPRKSSMFWRDFRSGDSSLAKSRALITNVQTSKLQDKESIVPAGRPSQVLYQTQLQLKIRAKSHN